MYVGLCVCMREGTQHHGVPPPPRKRSLLTDQCMSLYIGVSPMIGGDGLFSFNSKLAVLVREPDLQIKKVRHAHLILVNLPLHISPACQLLCDSNHHRHKPLLWPPWISPTLAYSSCSFSFRTDIYVSQISHFQQWNSVIFPKIVDVVLVRERHLIWSSTFKNAKYSHWLSARGWTRQQQGF